MPKPLEIAGLATDTHSDRGRETRRHRTSGRCSRLSAAGGAGKEAITRKQGRSRARCAPQPVGGWPAAKHGLSRAYRKASPIDVGRVATIPDGRTRAHDAERSHDSPGAEITMAKIGSRHCTRASFAAFRSWSVLPG
jgi:hypothetical protein